MADATTILMDTLDELASCGKKRDEHARNAQIAQSNYIAAQTEADEKADYVRTLLRDHSGELSPAVKNVANVLLDQFAKAPKDLSQVQAADSQQTFSVDAPKGSGGRTRFSQEEAQALVKAVLTREGQKLVEIEAKVHEAEPGLTKSAMRNALGRLREAGAVVTEGRVAGMTYRLK